MIETLYYQSDYPCLYYFLATYAHLVLLCSLHSRLDSTLTLSELLYELSAALFKHSTPAARFPETFKMSGKTSAMAGRNGGVIRHGLSRSEGICQQPT